MPFDRDAFVRAKLAEAGMSQVALHGWFQPTKNGEDLWYSYRVDLDRVDGECVIEYRWPRDRPVILGRNDGVIVPVGDPDHEKEAPPDDVSKGSRVALANGLTRDQLMLGTSHADRFGLGEIENALAMAARAWRDSEPAQRAPLFVHLVRIKGTKQVVIVANKSPLVPVLDFYAWKVALDDDRLRRKRGDATT